MPLPNASGPDATSPWLRHWFPVAFERDLQGAELTRITIHGLGLVLFRSEGGELTCLRDRCPHRHARLSDGRLVDGSVECLYHGWKFGKSGACAHIPQLAQDQEIPAGASVAAFPLRVIDGLIWVFPSEGETPPPPAPPADLRAEGVHVIDFCTDLPYDQAALIENVLDFAHIHIAHDGVRGGGHRSHAGPLRFDIEDSGADGFSARFDSSPRDAGDAREESTRTAGASIAFRAPGLVHYVSTFQDPGRVSGLALYSVPLTEDRCRLLYRAYGNHFPKSDRERPRWKEHLHQMLLLEQDMAVVLGQSAELADTGEPLDRSWMPIKSSDQLVLRYRQWLDEHASDLPGMIGWRTRKAGRDRAAAPRPATDRYTLHTRHCADCRGTLRAERLLFRRLAVCAALALLLAVTLPLWGSRPPGDLPGGLPGGLPRALAAVALLATAAALGWRSRIAFRRAQELRSDPLRLSPPYS